MVGIYHKWRIGSPLKDLKYKEFNFPDLQKIHYGPTLRLGINNLMLFAYYDLATLFVSKKAVNYNSFQQV
jgi:hypothetical protein